MAEALPQEQTEPCLPASRLRFMSIRPRPYWMATSGHPFRRICAAIDGGSSTLGVNMAKYARLILALICATVGIGAAEAQQRGNIQSGHRVSMVSAEYRTELPQRPEMQTRDGDSSWCDDSGGGLECGWSQCFESEGSMQSYCIANGDAADMSSDWPY